MTSTVDPASRILTRISEAELTRRWNAVRQVMKQRGIDAVVMQNSNDWLGGYVKWFTDLPANNGYPRTVVFHADAPMSVVEMGPSNIRRTFAADETLHRGVGEMLHTPSFTSIGYTDRDDAELAIDALRQKHILFISTFFLSAKTFLFQFLKLKLLSGFYKKQQVRPGH